MSFRPVGIKFDEIGVWSELKLEIVEQYGAAYTQVLKNKNFKKYYIDGFSGSGVNLSKKTGEIIDGSPLRALKIIPPFDGYFFVDLDQEKTETLERICSERKNVKIYTGDCNKELLENIFPKIRYCDYSRALCLLDPYGLHLNWEVIKMAGKSNVMDMFLNFPVMDMNRNAIWKNPEKAPAKGKERLNKFWGDNSWENAAYSMERDLLGPLKVKQDNEVIVAAFIERLKNIAEFKFVADPLPMKNSSNAVVYYLIFAAQVPVAAKIVKDIFDKYRG